MRLVRSRHCDGGTAGGATGLVNTPASNNRRHMRKVFSSGPISTGTIGVWVGPMSNPSERNPSCSRRVLAQSRSRRFRLVLEHPERSQHARRVGRRQRRGEDERPADVLEIVDHALAAGHEAADRRQRLAEGAGDDVHRRRSSRNARRCRLRWGPARRARARRRAPAPSRTCGPPAAGPGTSAMFPSIEYTPSTMIMDPRLEPFRSMRRSRLARSP
jgi:hypothetical protein